MVKSYISLLVFCLDDLSIVDSKILKSFTIALLCISSFGCDSICLICLGTLMLGIYIFLIAVSLWWIDALLTWLSLSFVTVFGLSPILSDINIAAPPFFGFPLAWNIFFYPIILSLHVSLKLMTDSSCRQHIVGSWFCFYFLSIQPLCVWRPGCFLIWV